MVYHLGKYATVSAKIPEELKERLKKMDVNTSRFIRNAIQREIRRREKEKLRKMAEEISITLKKIPPQEITENIRETREER
ncbi:MAG: hypothetical protein ACOC6G_00840 [Thermoproteota archaeon]